MQEQPQYVANFGIEQYLDQMRNNPYRDEITRDILKEKHKYLRFHFSSAMIARFTPEQETFILNLKSAQLIKLRSKLRQCSQDPVSMKRTIDEFQKTSGQLEPTNLRISTMTACSSVGCKIDTAYLYQCFTPPSDILCTIPGSKKKYKSTVEEIVIGCKAEDYESKGFFEKEKKSNFFNSAALNVLIYDNKCINVKVFNNGKLQMTGVPSEEHGKRAVEIVIELFRSIPDSERRRITEDKLLLRPGLFRTVMINSDYYCGTEVKRENLYQILEEKYNLSVNFESENYPGVKLEYFWNTKYLHGPNEGRCACSLGKCIGKGSGEGEGNCKKITISTFQSGSVIVTGARNIQQLRDGYAFMNTIFQDNYEYIKKSEINNVKNSNNIFIKKSNITNFAVYEKLVELHKHFPGVSTTRIKASRVVKEHERFRV